MFNWKKDYRGNLQWLKDRTCLLVRHGSHAYGLAIETSDLDIKGIAIPPDKYFHGFLHKFEQAESKDPDLVMYDIRKFFQLACDCNPNIIEILWVDDCDVIQENWIGKTLRDYRHKFLSQKAKHTFSGYAYAQLKRIKTHKKWLMNPPSRKPTRSEFDLPETSLLSKDILGAVEAVVGKTGSSGITEFGPTVMETYRKERSYHNAMREFSQYENWKQNRNPARAELEKNFGYDTKHAMHLVRLMRMCVEILDGQGVIVKRPDRDELLAIRSGAWSYDRLIDYAQQMETLTTKMLADTKLPKSPDRVHLDGLCAAWVQYELEIKREI